MAGVGVIAHQGKPISLAGGSFVSALFAGLTSRSKGCGRHLEVLKFWFLSRFGGSA